MGTNSPEYMARYRRTESGKQSTWRYNHSEKGRARSDRYQKSEHGKRIDRARDKRRKSQNREIVRTAKDVPCADCGNRFDTVCMDFHHVQSKKFNVGWGRYTPKQLLEEIEKCIVLCACCHRLRHKCK